MDSKLLCTHLGDLSEEVVFNNMAQLDLLTLEDSTRDLQLGIYSQGLSGLR